MGQLAHGAKTLLDYLRADLDEARAEVAAGLERTHTNPGYVSDRLRAVDRLLLTLLSRVEDDVKPRLQRKEANTDLAAQLAELRQRLESLEAMQLGKVVPMPSRKAGSS